MADSCFHKENTLAQKCLSRGVLIVALCVVLATPAGAQQNLRDMGRNIVIGIVAVTAAVVVITVVIVHESRKKRRITGCVNSGENGMSVTDEKDKGIYTLTGETSGIKPGNRVTLQGKNVKPKGDNKPLTWEVSKETKDFGACRL